MNRQHTSRADAVDDERAWQHHARTQEEADRAREYNERMGHDGHDASSGHMPLFDGGVSQDFRTRWSEIQTAFVDDPRRAVEEANHLVADMTDRLNDMFVQNRNDLERHWTAGGEASTEELRLALQRYRSFFERLLTL